MIYFQKTPDAVGDKYQLINSYRQVIGYLQPDTSFVYEQILSQISITNVTCSTCGEYIQNRSVQLYENRGKDKADGYAFGCLKCARFAVRFDLSSSQQGWYVSDNIREIVALDATWRCNEHGLVVHSEPNFWAFNLEPLYNCKPYALACLSHQLRNDAVFHSFVKDLIGWIRHLRQTHSRDYTFTSVGGRMWVVGRQPLQIPTDAPRYTHLSNMWVSLKYYEDQNTNDTLKSLLITISSRIRAGARVEPKLAEGLTMIARSRGFIVPEVSSEFVVRMDTLLRKFGDPKSIRARKRVKK